MGKNPLSAGSSTEDIDSEPRKPRSVVMKDSDSDGDSGTNSLEKFDWSEEEPSEPEPSLRAIRGRWLWIALMKLAMPVRVLLISILGSAFFVTPLLVVNLRFREQPAWLQVHVWSLWLAVIWDASCATYLIVDLVPRFLIGAIRLFGGQIERLKIQVEVGRSLLI